jgi:hypothetical protein
MASIHGCTLGSERPPRQLNSEMIHGGPQDADELRSYRFGADSVV